jgi:hypothetical protein
VTTTSLLDPPETQQQLAPEQSMPTSKRRVANKTGEEECERCGDDGTVVASIEIRDDGAEHDVAGPCPNCEKGYAVEFGIGRDRDGLELRAKKPPWGPNGFWRGRVVPAGLL